MADRPIYLELDEDILEVLSQNHLTIEEVLRRAHIDAKVTDGVAPYAADSGKKEIVTIILATGVSVMFVCVGIAKVLHPYLNRPRFAEIDNLVELRQADGNILTDRSGQAQFKRQRTLEIRQPHLAKSSSDTEGSFGPNGVVIRLRETNDGIN